MLIITADDLGLDEQVTDRILSSFNMHRISSASAMVFMKDTIRAAERAAELNLEVGLHLNFTLPFSASNVSSKLKTHQNAISSYLLSSRFCQLIYNPFLRDSFHFVFRAQQEEFYRLYGKHPNFYNGHHHMHLCSNIILSNLLPRQVPVRRTFTFKWGEKDLFDILYRRLLDCFIDYKYISTDHFYSLGALIELETLQKFITLSRIKNIEIMVHPNRDREFIYIQSNDYFKLLNLTKVGSFKEIIRT
jgi:predicted glycoside hydrolase/deacetylase ChbG (UPF0249 family)